jgi:hypothetical protein
VTAAFRNDLHAGILAIAAATGLGFGMIALTDSEIVIILFLDIPV